MQESIRCERERERAREREEEREIGYASYSRQYKAAIE